MAILEVECFGITIKYDEGNRGNASITSDFKGPDAPDGNDYNAAVDGIEHLILAHFGAGIDITSPQYLEGIKTAFESIVNIFD